MSKTIWIINESASTPDVGYAGRWFYLSKYLAKEGYNIYLISSSYSHIYRNPPKFDTKYLVQECDGFKFVWLKVPKYKNSFDKRRILNWFIFNNNLKNLPKIIPHKPDFIVISSPSLIPSMGAYKLSKKLGAKFIFDVRDIWPLSLIDIGGYSKFHPFIVFLQMIENMAYKNSYITTSPLEKSILHMKKHGLDESKFRWIPNGCDFEEMQNPSQLDPKVASMIPKDKFIIGYCGTLGAANAVEYLVKSAKLLRDNKNIFFVIVGDGKDKQHLKMLANGLTNIIFIDAISKKSVQNMLKLFDLCYFSLKDEKVFEFGISPNKIPEYLYSAKPLLYSFSGYGNDMIDHNFGFKVRADDENALAQEIFKIYKIPKEKLDQMGKNAKDYALKHYSYKELAKKFIEIFQ